MARGRFQGILRGGRPRSPKDWYQLLSFSGVVVPGTPQCGWAITPSTIQEQLTDPTFLAARIYLEAGSTAATATNASVVAFGLIVWNFVDNTVPTQCPRPISDADSDWLWHFAAPAVISGGALLEVGNGGCDADRWTKARRKLGNDKSLLWCVEALGVVSWNFHVHGRGLVKQ